MNDSFPFYVYSGLLTKEHRKRIGSALWEFLWCINRTTKEVDEDGEMVGLVLKGKPVHLTEISDDLGGSKSTIHRNIEKLEENGYLLITRAPYGLIIRVRNSKKWVNTSVRKTEQDTKNNHNAVRKTEQPLQKRDGRSKNDNSNKDKAVDKTKDLKDVVVGGSFENSNENSLRVLSRQDAVPENESDADSGQKRIDKDAYRQQVAEKYLQRRKKGFHLSRDDELALNEIIQEGIPFRTVIAGIDKAFDEFNPKHSRDEIRSLRYCLPIIFDLHYVREEEKHGATRGYDQPGRHPKASGEDEGQEQGYWERKRIAKRI